MHRTPSQPLSPLQTKGVLTLTLLVLAESVSFVNAVSFWNQFQNTKQKRFTSTSSKARKQHNGGGLFLFASAASLSSDLPQKQQQQQAVDATAAGECPAFSSRSHSELLADMPLFNEETCCQEACRPCMEASTVATLCRGGHGTHSHSTANAAAEAVASALPYNIPLPYWKVMFQCFLTFLNVMCWLIPLRSKKISENKLALSLANAFSGGVFLSLAFGHLIPECLHGFDPAQYNEATPFMLVLAGYLLIFFVEKVAFDAHDILHEMEHAHGPSSAPATPEAVRGGHGHSHSKTPVNGSTAETASSGRSAVILLGALAVHSILEMMALGLADSFADCALLTVSISLHQPAESIALLVAFLKSGLSKKQILTFLSIFSCMGPIGVMLGMLVNEYAAPIVDSIMLAVVAGTFVYVGATEVIPEEWEDSSHKWKKFAALMSGIVSIFAITQYTMTLH